MKNEGIIFMAAETGGGGGGEIKGKVTGAEPGSGKGEAASVEENAQQEAAVGGVEAGKKKRSWRTKFKRLFGRGQKPERIGEGEKGAGEGGVKDNPQGMVTGAASKDNEDTLTHEERNKAINEYMRVDNLDVDTKRKLRTTTFKFTSKGGRIDVVSAYEIADKAGEGLVKMLDIRTWNDETLQNFKRYYSILETDEATRNLIYEKVLGRGDKTRGIDDDLERGKKKGEWLLKMLKAGAVGKIKEVFNARNLFESAGEDSGDASDAESIVDDLSSVIADRDKRHAAPAPTEGEAQQSGAGGAGGGGVGNGEAGVLPAPGEPGESSGSRDLEKDKSRLQRILDRLKDPKWWKRRGYQVGILFLLYLAIQLAVIYGEAEAIEKITTGH